MGQFKVFRNGLHRFSSNETVDGSLSIVGMAASLKISWRFWHCKIKTIERDQRMHI